MCIATIGLIARCPDSCGQDSSGVPATKPSAGGTSDLVAEAERAEKRAIAKPYIPEAKDIDKIVAEVYDHQLTPFFPDIGPFEIPRDDYEKVLHYFRNAQLDERLPSSVSVEMGTIRFIMKEGGGFRIC
ncbi:MAG: hypothetical protein ABFD16_02730, partial [Thermoguttaceae bacterium]